MTNNDDVPGWRTKIWPFPRPKPQPQPEPVPQPDDADPGRAKWLRAWLILRGTKIEHLRAVLGFVPMTVFFAVTGMVTWALIVLRVLIWLVKAVLA